MNKSELIAAVAEKANITKKDADKVVADFVKSVDVITAEKEKDIMSV